MDGVHGSHRRPALIVRRGLTFQSSCAQKWNFFSVRLIVRPESCVKFDGKPIMMSAGR